MLRSILITTKYYKQLNFVYSEIRKPVCNGFFYSQQTRWCSSSVDNLYNVDYDVITKGDPDLLKKLKVIMLEMEVLRQNGGMVPQSITTERWIDILNMKSRNQRLNLLTFLRTNELKKQKDKEKKKLKRLAREESSANFTRDNGHIYYGFGGCTIFLRIYDTTIDRWNNWKLMEAMLFSQTLVIDCGYDKHMSNHELSNCAKQLVYLFAENRSHKQPFNLNFCNAFEENLLMKKLHKLIPSLYDGDFPLNITSKSYLDIFPKEQLVYLTPHCREELHEYNEDNIYIIGAMVDKSNNEPLSLAKAKAEGIKMAKFPIDRYLDWNIGTKSLTVNQSLKIMLDIRDTKDWDKALLHVPRRKLRTDEEETKEFGNKQKFESPSKRKLYSTYKRNRLIDILS